MKRAISAKTERILRRVIAAILEEPKRLNMDLWGTFFGKEAAYSEERLPRGQKVPPCRTTACIAGHALLVTRAGINFLKEENCILKDVGNNDYVDFPHSTDEEAQKILGITEEQSAKLFYLPEWERDDKTGWPAKFSTRYAKAKTPKTRAKVAAARIEHFIATGE